MTETPGVDPATSTADVDLEAIRDRCGAPGLTPGPWRRTARHTRTEPPVYVFSVAAYPDGAEIGYTITGEGLPEEDAEFIAHARTDVPALLTEVDRLRAALADARRRIAAAAALHPRYICEEGEFCGTCSLDDVPEDWPCPTVRALSAGGTDPTGDKS